MNRSLKISIIAIIPIILLIYLIGKYNPISMEFIITQHGLIRDFIKNGNSSWKKMVDESLHSDIENHLS